eukprot:2807505-Amphidinium_carterae.1
MAGTKLCKESPELPIIILPVTKEYRFPLAEEKDPYSEQWRFSHCLIGTGIGGTNPAQRFPHKDDTTKIGGTKVDNEPEYERDESIRPRDVRKFTSSEDVPPPPVLVEGGGRRDGSTDGESTRVLPPMTSTGSSSGARAPYDRDRAPDRKHRGAIHEEDTSMVRTEKAEEVREYHDQQGNKPSWWPEEKPFYPCPWKEKQATTMVFHGYVAISLTQA